MTNYNLAVQLTTDFIGKQLQIMTEQQIQSECFIWHWNTYPKERGMLHHNNNNSHNRNKGSQMKALGVVEGVADFELVIPNIVLFIEMKTPEGSLSQAQKDFRRMVQERGHIYCVKRTVEDFKKLVKQAYGEASLAKD